MHVITNEFNKLGEVLKPSDVCRLLNLDCRTVKKHASNLGGFEIYPGCYRFFSNVILNKVKLQRNPEKAAGTTKNNKSKVSIDDRHNIFN
jgi:hypothetical protein